MNDLMPYYHALAARLKTPGPRWWRWLQRAARALWR